MTTTGASRARARTPEKETEKEKEACRGRKDQERDGRRDVNTRGGRLMRGGGASKMKTRSTPSSTPCAFCFSFHLVPGGVADPPVSGEPRAPRSPPENQYVHPNASISSPPREPAAKIRSAIGRSPRLSGAGLNLPGRFAFILGVNT
ncbi:hypothetical protein EYF80_031838 [Liparis tanakae]|uniref:Uncharacterized protein n=1 Tax=Liparis tanakae TaxID=230148 RepID=A0A4Z2GZ36_9TELE|nr:hypothetical protein EYF80_031838 [Liparis tanakae]